MSCPALLAPEKVACLRISRPVALSPAAPSQPRLKTAIAMSATVTDTGSAALVTAALQDYTIRLVGDPEPPPEQQRRQQQEQPPEQEQHDQEQHLENPPGWHDQRRQVPPYRPVNRRLDRAQRPAGVDTATSLFVGHLFAGVWLQAVSARRHSQRAGRR